jgi:NAD-dependent SIR2 family protein deacetylase
MDSYTIPLTDKALTCVDCGNQFAFNAGEQRFYLSKGLSTPKRCPDCRQKRKNTLVREEQEGRKENATDIRQ